MKTTFVVRVLMLVTLVAVMGRPDWRADPGDIAQAQSNAPAFAINAGGIVGEGDDFATTVLNDAWDMNEISDAMPWYDLPNVAVNGGVLSYNLPGPWGGIPLLAPGSQVGAGKSGGAFPINADYYHWLSFRIKQPAGSIVRARWHTATGWQWEPYATTNDISVATSDWQTYVIDLKTYPRIAGTASWTGQVFGLYLDSYAPDGSQVSLDWARLTANNPSTNSLMIDWSELTGTANFYLDSDSTGCEGTPITKTVTSASGSFLWWQAGLGIASPANVAPGDYYVCAKSGGNVLGRSAGQVTVRPAPVFRITKPSYTSGPDYATEAGNPWDMSDGADAWASNASSSVQNGNLVVNVPSNQGDPQVHFNLPGDTPIDSSRYYYLTYKLWVNYPYSYWVDGGQNTRVFWGQGGSSAQSLLIYDFPGWQAYSIDLRTLGLAPGAANPPWTTSPWTWFRLDPVSNPGHINVTFYIDDVKLTGDERADTYAPLEWEVITSTVSPMTMTLYYDTDRSGLNGTPITTLALDSSGALPLALSPAGEADAPLAATDSLTYTVFLPTVLVNYCQGSCYAWDTRAVPAGTYYVYACVNDGYNRPCRYSETPLMISHP